MFNAHVKRSFVAGAAVATVLLGIASCSSNSSIEVTARQFPEGSPELHARPSSESAVVLPPKSVQPIDPGQLFVPAININANILSLPTEMSPAPFLGGNLVSSFGVPPDMSQTAWWSDGPRIGSSGMAVIVGHSQVGGGYGVFNLLGSLRPHDEISVEDPAGALRVVFRVIEVVPGISKRDPTALQQVLAAHPSDARLALITCGGEFDSATAESEDNVVVFAAAG